ncbi:hypothetical protein D3C80_872750 [compost metagenome]
MQRRQAGQSLLEQGFVEDLPIDKGRLQALFADKVPADGLSVATILQLLQAVGEQGTAPRLKLRIVQVLRGALERVKERARQRRENGLPAQQAEQTVEQGVLHVMHLTALLCQMQLRRLLYPQRRLLQRQLQFDQASLCFHPSSLRRPAQLALQAWQDPRQRLDFDGTGGLCGNFRGQRMGLVPLLTAFEHPNPPNPCLRVLAARVDPQRQVPVAQAFTVLAKLIQQARAATSQPGIIAVQ